MECIIVVLITAVGDLPP